MEIIKKTENDELYLALVGRLDTNTVSEFESEIVDIDPSIKKLVLDLEQLEYISSAGLRVLLMAYKKMSVEGEMKLVNVQEIVKEILDITGFSDFLTIEG